MKKIIILLTTLISLGLIANIYAQEPNIQPSSNQSLAGPYLGFGAGALGEGAGLYEPLPILRFYVGYLWQKSPNLLYGFEAGTDLSIISSLDIQGVLKYHFNNGFNVFTKAGGAKWVDTIFGDSIIAPESAIGIGYNFTKHFNTNITYTYYFSTSGGEGISKVLANIEYHFG